MQSVWFFSERHLTHGAAGPSPGVWHDLLPRRQEHHHCARFQETSRDVLTVRIQANMLSQREFSPKIHRHQPNLDNHIQHHSTMDGYHMLSPIIHRQPSPFWMRIPCFMMFGSVQRSLVHPSSNCWGGFGLAMPWWFVTEAVRSSEGKRWMNPISMQERGYGGSKPICCLNEHECSMKY